LKSLFINLYLQRGRRTILEVLTAVLLKTRVFWDVTQCRLVYICRSFEESQYLKHKLLFLVMCICIILPP